MSARGYYGLGDVKMTIEWPEPASSNCKIITIAAVQTVEPVTTESELFYRVVLRFSIDFLLSYESGKGLVTKAEAVV
jgi:hypothetical protein